MKQEEKLRIKKETYSSANILEVEAGTNTPMGGDAGHGGKTILRLSNKGATSWTLVCYGGRNNEVIEIEDPDEIAIKLYGDTEAQTFAAALFFAFQTLAMQIEEKEQEQKDKRKFRDNEDQE